MDLGDPALTGGVPHNCRSFPRLADDRPPCGFRIIFITKNSIARVELSEARTRTDRYCPGVRLIRHG